MHMDSLYIPPTILYRTYPTLPNTQSVCPATSLQCDSAHFAIFSAFRTQMHMLAPTRIVSVPLIARNLPSVYTMPLTAQCQDLG